MDNISSKLAGWTCAQRFQDLPHEVVHEVKRRLVDSLGCALGAWDSVPARIAREIAAPCQTENGASVIGAKVKTSADLAAFANGIMIRYLDYNDTYLSKEPAHPSDNISAAIAVAESERRSVRDFITAVVIGYEVQCRLADAASLRALGWDHVTYGALSTACLSSYLLGLDETATGHAISLAGVANVALRQTRAGELSMWKACAFPNAARNGVFAAYLAKMGMTGPSDIFEGQFGFCKLVSGDFSLPSFGGEHGKPFMITDTYIKAFPAEYHSQTAITAALEIRKEIERLDQIEGVQIRSFDAAVDIIAGDPEKWNPTTRETADHSLPYCVAVALADGEVSLNSFSEARMRDPHLLALVKKITVQRDPELSALYPEANPNDVQVRLSTGKVIARRVDYALGHPKNKMTDEDISSKFKRLAQRKIQSESTMNQVLDCLWRLDDLGSVDEFMSELQQF